MSQLFSAHPALSTDQGEKPRRAPSEPLLAVDEIQGNIITGFNKDHQAFLFLQIVDVDAAKRWLSFVADAVATTREVLAHNRLFRALRARRGDEPTGLVATWMNLAVSAEGLRKLTSAAEVESFRDEGFRLGLAERAGDLGDELPPNRWVIGGPQSSADVLLIVASDDSRLLDDQITIYKARLGTSGLQLIFEQRGSVLPAPLKGHEHFGFRDGISQPGIRGRVSLAARDFVTPRFVDPADPRAAVLGKPGQPLIWPGQFVFGYPGQDPQDPIASGRTQQLGPDWAVNGSYLVVRRLVQDVGGFWAFMRLEAARLAALPDFAGMDPIKLASLLVGRWPSGAPIMRTPDHDDSQLGMDNAFGFAHASTPIPVTQGPADTLPQAPADPDGRRCPFAAHIRKVNPRDVVTEQGGANDTLTRLMLRRGIPFGPAVFDPLHASAEELAVERGLLFASYQSSIVSQFEFVMKTWANDPNKPDRGGHDPIIGQSVDFGGVRDRRADLPGANGAAEPIRFLTEFVRPTGGGYFFSPSISAIKQVLAKP